MIKSFQLAFSLRLLQCFFCKNQHFQAFGNQTGKSTISKSFHTTIINSSMSYSKNDVLEVFNRIVPPLTFDKHKGQAGRVGTIGGSEEYTGAPYYAAITALKVGADLSHVICAQSASPVIKSFSPELIVHPLLDKENSFETIKFWLSKFSSVTVGPGLGRDPAILNTVRSILEYLKSQNKPIVIDADGLFIVTEDPNIIHGYQKVILTPNVVEFGRLFKALKLKSEKDENKMKHISETIALSQALGGVTIVRKGPVDVIVKGDQVALMDEPGSPRRCGGQGDLLSGAMNVFSFWAYDSHEQRKLDIEPGMVAAFGASVLTRRCAVQAFEKHRRSTITTDLVEEIGSVFFDSKL